MLPQIVKALAATTVAVTKSKFLVATLLKSLLIYINSLIPPKIKILFVAANQKLPQKVYWGDWVTSNSFIIKLENYNFK